MDATPITPAELDAIEAMLSAADAAPWRDDGADKFRPGGWVHVVESPTDPILAELACSFPESMPHADGSENCREAVANVRLIVELRNRAAALVAGCREAARLRSLMSGEVAVKEFHYTDDAGLEVVVEHWGIKALAASLLDTFKALGGENYVTTTLGSAEGKLEVTIRPCWGGKKTPAETINELRAEVAKLRDLRPELCDLCWTCSYAPVPPDAAGQHIVTFKDGSRAECQCCALGERLPRVQAELAAMTARAEAAEREIAMSAALGRVRVMPSPPSGEPPSMPKCLKCGKEFDKADYKAGEIYCGSCRPL